MKKKKSLLNGVELFWGCESGGIKTEMKSVEDLSIASTAAAVVVVVDAQRRLNDEAIRRKEDVIGCVHQ